MHRILAGLIAVVLAAGIATAILKHGNSKPVVLGTPTPAQTYTFPGLPPTATPSETPVIPPTESPKASPTALAGTGSGSTAGPAVMILSLAFLGGLVVLRTSRRA